MTPDSGKDISGKTRGRRLQLLHLRGMVPNAITLAALCFGLTAMQLAIAGDFRRAALAIVIAIACDGIDGRVARLLKKESRFGAELDSLADLTAHGVAPAFVMYLWSLKGLSWSLTDGPPINAGWLIALVYASCCALRLARFNTSLDPDGKTSKVGFLTGVPAPLAAGLCLSPLFLSLWLGDIALLRHPLLVGLVVAGTAFLMVSSLPTLTFERLLRPASSTKHLCTMLGVVLYVASFFSAPWMTLSWTFIIYTMFLPVGWRWYKQDMHLMKQGPLSFPPSEN